MRLARFVLAGIPILAIAGAPTAAQADCGHRRCGERAAGCGHGCWHHGDRTGCPPRAASRGPTAPGTAGVYDVDTVTRVSGTVIAVEVVPARGARRGGLRATLERKGAPMQVHLGPTWFLEREGVRLSKGDSLDVTGSLVAEGEASALIAREIHGPEDVVRLRDAAGRPAWADPGGGR